MNTVEGISAIIPVAERVDDIENLLNVYHDVLDGINRPFEIICVLDGKFANLQSNVKRLSDKFGDLSVIVFSRTFGESAALSAAITHAKYDLVLTLPSYEQVESSDIPILLKHIDAADIVVARRWPRKDSGINRFSNKAFHAILRWMTGVSFRDIGCGVRLIRKRVFDEIAVYGDQHRFLPVLADHRGFTVVEVDLPQANSDSGTRIYAPRVYVSRILDLIGVFFLARFTKKPLRFFGMIGSIMGTVGVAILTVAVIQRYFFNIALADRPVLLLGSLFLVLGVQLFALGLVGELIIFTSGRDLNEYAIEETVNMDKED